MPPARFREPFEAFSKAFWDGRQPQLLAELFVAKFATVGRDENARGNNSQSLLERLCFADELLPAEDAGDSRIEINGGNCLQDKTKWEFRLYSPVQEFSGRACAVLPRRENQDSAER
jgi:hypothetical protein